MTIPIRKRTIPTITLTGQEVVSGVIQTSASYAFNASNNKIVIEDANNVRQQDPKIFYGTVQFSVTAPYTTYSYNASADQEQVGSAMTETVAGAPVVGDNCEIYVTFNGKDPVRTKKYLWQGRTRYISYNMAGCDNIVAKARTYYRGEMSDILTVEFKVIKTDNAKVDNYYTA